MAPPKLVQRRRRRNPGMWEDDELGANQMAYWVKMGQAEAGCEHYVGKRSEQVLADMRMYAAVDKAGKPVRITPGDEVDGYRHYEVTKPDAASTLTFNCAIDPIRELVKCDCGHSTHSFRRPCKPIGGIMMWRGWLKTHEDWISEKRGAPEAIGTPDAMAELAKATPKTSAPNPPPATKPKQNVKAIEGSRVSFEDLKQGTTDRAMGIYAETQPIYLDPKRIEGAVEIEEGARKVRVFGTRSVISDFTTSIIRPQLEVQVELATAPAAGRRPAASMATSTTVASSERAYQDLAPDTSPVNQQNGGAPTSDPTDDEWLNPERAAEALIATYDISLANGTPHALDTNRLLQAMYSFEDPALHLPDPAAYRQRLYELGRPGRATIGQNPSQISRAVSRVRPELEYWTSARWEQCRGATNADDQATDKRKNAKFGHGGQHWLAPRKPP